MISKLIYFCSPINFINLRYLKSGLGSEILKDGMRVLDVGSGAGYYKDVIAKQNSEYIMIDPFNDRADINCSADRLPFKSEYADVIICFDVLQHLDDPELALREFNRVLKKDGRLITTQAFLYPECDVNDRFRWSIDGIAILLQKTGFNVIDRQRRGGAIFAIYCLLIWCIQHIIPRTGKWRISSEKRMRKFLIYIISFLVLITRPLGYLALIIDKIVRVKGIYMGTLIVGAPRK